MTVGDHRAGHRFPVQPDAEAQLVAGLHGEGIRHWTDLQLVAERARQHGMPGAQAFDRVAGAPALQDPGDVVGVPLHGAVGGLAPPAPVHDGEGCHVVGRHHGQGGIRRQGSGPAAAVHREQRFDQGARQATQAAVPVRTRRVVSDRQGVGGGSGQEEETVRPGGSGGEQAKQAGSRQGSHVDLRCYE